RPRRVRWRDVPLLVERHGPDGVPIVLLVNLLVGLILGYQAALQLQKYGASIFVADLVGLSVVRELGPLMTAIIVAGRSGAAFAAEIGTMKVSEEVDALRTIGLSPYGFLVWPRALALALVLPVLTLLADGFGVLGGMLVGVGALGLAPIAYWNETVGAIGWNDVASGLIKSFAFAFVIALIACERGLQTTGGAEGVGRSTTSSVVSTILSLIVLDAVFAVLFSMWGI
ncbi:MAG TPA: ABC transporter permease, partial [Planctomycetota bacterium]|nr:ABC transporter permease [Planctomycetota bacterium]